jgi:hypothetical protein
MPHHFRPPHESEEETQKAARVGVFQLAGGHGVQKHLERG